MKVFAVLATVLASCAALREADSDSIEVKVHDHSKKQLHASKEWGRCPCTACSQSEVGNKDKKFTCLLEKSKGETPPTARDCEGGVAEHDEAFQKTTCLFTASEIKDYTFVHLEELPSKAIAELYRVRAG